MKGKQHGNDIRKRKKGNNFNNNSNNIVNKKHAMEREDEEMKSLRKSNGLINYAMDGMKVNGVKPENNDEQVEYVEQSEQRKVKRSFEITSDVFQRLGSMLREVKIDWLKQICKRNVDVDKTRNEASRMEYFSKELIFCFTVVFVLAIFTRTYKIETPPHVW